MSTDGLRAGAPADFALERDPGLERDRLLGRRTRTLFLRAANDPPGGLRSRADRGVRGVAIGDDRFPRADRRGPSARRCALRPMAAARMAAALLFRPPFS
mmetsp:Transcript_18831/g.57225  ORF Transcript_18831/g.57225 Transcript_18831/m.57225 type:complete len:100 (-) Transcript_18831:795-1094(-)